MNNDFFPRLPPIRHLSGLVDDSYYRPAPEDWLVVVSDIVNSTNAVESGRYKDVNMVGACVITATLNVTDSRNTPFAFGGDGATLLIPAEAHRVVADELARTRDLAMRTFGLVLRVGIVPISDLRAHGTDVRVARYEVSEGNFLAMFSGGGVDLAERWIKQDETGAAYRIADDRVSGPPDLNGLSCRWNPIKPRRDRVVCLLASAARRDDAGARAVMSDLMGRLRAALGEDIDEANPIHPETLRFRWPPVGLLTEAQLTRGRKSLTRRVTELLAETLVQWFAERFSLRAGAYDAATHRAEMSRNNDFCRVNDELLMVLDCTLDQAQRIRATLEDASAEGLIHFGMSLVDQALMTCLVFDLSAKRHLHFIDGNGGGFWEAARAYKAQRNARESDE
ncbi:MAG: DUF3095 domain-containing protein [Gammaproteobacteria bacterium]